MVEGQSGLTWSRWQRLVLAAEELGLAGVHLSDHFVNPTPPDQDALETWTALTWAAASTERIDIGPLVSPVSFRHPALLARMATAVDELAGGRLILGVGAGWSEREHRNYGFDLLDVPRRLDRLEEGLEALTRLLRSDEAVTFDGEWFRLHDAVVRPAPVAAGRPPLLVAAKGRKRALPLVARYGDWWNTMFVTCEEFASLSAHLDDLLLAEERAPSEVARSVMLGVEIGADDDEVRRKLSQRAWATWREPGLVSGTPAEVADQLGAWAEAGARRVMLQWLDPDDLDGLALLASAQP